MPSNPTSILISEGFSQRSPWLVEELDTNLKNYAVASFASSGANQSTALKTQTQVLVEQTNQLEKMQIFAEKISSGSPTAVVVDASGRVLVSNARQFSDLIGRPVSSLANSEVDRLIELTNNLRNSVPAVNLGGQAYVSVTVNTGTPPVDRIIAAPLRVSGSDLSAIPDTALQAFTCYAYKAANGTITYRIVDSDNLKLSVTKVEALTNPDPGRLYDAFRINTGTSDSPSYKVFAPQDISKTFPTSASVETLYRNVFTGELRLVGPSNANIAFTNTQGFVVPANQNELNYWFGQSGSARLIATNTQLLADGVKMPIAPDTFQWKYKDFTGGGFGNYPPIKGLPSDVNLAVGSLVEDSNVGKIYFISGKLSGANTFVEVEKVGDPFVLRLSNENLLSIRGQYTERIAQMTQRTTEQQLFLNSLLQRFNLYFDAASNALKAFSDLNSKLSNSI